VSYFKGSLIAFLPVLSHPSLLRYENRKAIELNLVCLWMPFGLASKLKAKGQDGGVSSGDNARRFIYKGGFPEVVEDCLGRCLKWLSARSQ